MTDFDRDTGRGPEASVANSEEEEARRGIPPLFLFALVAIILAGIALAYQAFTKIPEVTETLASRDCLTCHAELLPSFKQEAVHNPFDSRRCVHCHTEHGLDLVETVTVIERVFSGSNSGEVKHKGISPGDRKRSKKAPKPGKKSKLKKPIKELCADDCHAELVSLDKKKDFVMEPFGKKQCLSCHKAHASKQAFLLKSRIKPLCLSCHPETAEYYSKENKHPPFKAGDCTSCHRGHASNVEPLLRRDTKTLCLSCHPKTAKLMKLAVQMEPFEVGSCPDCHNPHASGNKKLLQKRMPDLCFDCHQGIAQLRRKPVQMDPFRQGLCLECHRPHASEDPKLLVAALEKNEICYQCHEDIKKNYLSIGHNKVRNNASAYQPESGVGSCLNCHAPHGSDYAGLVQKEVIELCLTCHGPRRYFAHPVGFSWQDPWRGGYLSCTSCHNPMGSGIVRLKHKDRDDLCLSCHEANDPTFIYSKSGGWHYQVEDSFP